MEICSGGCGEETKPIQSQSKPISRACILAGRGGSVLRIFVKFILTAVKEPAVVAGMVLFP